MTRRIVLVLIALAVAMGAAARGNTVTFSTLIDAQGGKVAIWNGGGVDAIVKNTKRA